jgi:hypothetical protein
VLPFGAVQVSLTVLLLIALPIKEHIQTHSETNGPFLFIFNVHYRRFQKLVDVGDERERSVSLAGLGKV